MLWACRGIPPLLYAQGVISDRLRRWGRRRETRAGQEPLRDTRRATWHSQHMSARDASPVLVADTGEAVDGRRLLAEAVGFGRALRAAGLQVDLGAAIDFARSMSLVDMGQRAQVRDAGAAVFVRRRDDREVYDRVFDRFWRRRGRSLPPTRMEGAEPDVDREIGEEGASDEAAEGTGATLSELATIGVQLTTDADEEGGEIEGETISPDAWSRGEVLRHRDFDRMTSAELRDAERFVDLLRPRLDRRRTRRHALHPHGRRLAPRALLRRNLAT